MYKYPGSRSTTQSPSVLLLVQPDLQTGLPASPSDGFDIWQDHSVNKRFISGGSELQGNFLEGKSPLLEIRMK